MQYEIQKDSPCFPIVSTCLAIGDPDPGNSTKWNFSPGTKSFDLSVRIGNTPEGGRKTIIGAKQQENGMWRYSVAQSEGDEEGRVVLRRFRGGLQSDSPKSLA